MYKVLFCSVNYNCYLVVQVFPVILGTLSFLCSDRSDSDILLSTLLALSSFLVDENQGGILTCECFPGILLFHF